MKYALNSASEFRETCSYFWCKTFDLCDTLFFFVMKTNLMQYLSLIYFVKQPLHVSGLFIAHHQEEFTVYVQQFVRVTRLGDWQQIGSG
jgi:hypothetical protein